MQYDVRLENAPSDRLLAVMKRCASARELSRIVPQCCGVVWDAIRKQGIKGAGRHVAVYFDDAINLEVGVELAAEFSGHGEVVASELPSGVVATATHFGPYHQLGDAHQAIQNWCQSHGYALAGPRWEIYGHWIDAWNSDPSQIRTEVFYLTS